MFDYQANTPEEALAAITTSQGFHRYADLMVAKLGGSKEDYLPFLVAVSLDVSTMVWAEMLNQLRDSKSALEMLGMVTAQLAGVVEFQKLSDFAAEQIGYDNSAPITEYTDGEH